MSLEPVESALFAGRFNHFTNGHKEVTDKAMSLACRTLLLVGSSQESGTLRNPFDVNIRIKLIEETYEKEILQGKLIVAPLPDMTSENDIPEDGAWGRFVLEYAKRYLHKLPDMMIYGNDEARSRWFDLNDIKTMDEHVVSRLRNPISATKIRQYLLEDNREAWNENVPPRIHRYYGQLREMLLATKPYRQLYEDMLKPVDHSWKDKGV